MVIVLCAVFCVCPAPAASSLSAILPESASPQSSSPSAGGQQDQQSPKEPNQPAADQSSTGAQSGAGPSQPDPQGAPKPDATANPGQQETKSSEPQKATSNDRLFWTLPNFMTVEGAGHAPPLTAGQKFKLVARGVFDPVEFVWVGVIAGISQANNSDPSYGQGAEGYGKRYATAYGDTVIENFMVGAILPSLLRQDPRYYQLGKGGFLHRSAYAVGRLFVTRSDSGHKQFNYSEIFGSALAAGISTYSYHPHSERSLGDVASVWGTQLASDAVATMLKEFWPDIRHKLHKKTGP